MFGNITNGVQQVDAATKQLDTGDFRQDAVSNELVREQKDVAAALYRIAARVNKYDIPGALILKAVARRNSWLAKKGGR
jgi:hypothetical protein